MKKIPISRLALVAVAAIMWWLGWTNLDAYLSTRHILNFILALLCIIGGIGLVLGHRWSRLPVYLSSALLFAIWIYWVFLATVMGLGYDSASHTFFGLLIALVPSLVAAACSFIVYRYFADGSASK